MSKCVVFTGGRIDDDLSFIDLNEVKRSFVICADSGYIYAKKIGIKPDIIIGDYDSLDLFQKMLKKNLFFLRKKTIRIYCLLLRKQ